MRVSNSATCMGSAGRRASARRLWLMDKVLGAYATPKNRKHNRARRGSHTIRQFSSLVRFGGFLVAGCAARGWRGPGFGKAAGRHDRAHANAFPAALRGDAGRRVGQYRAAVGDAGDRPRDRDFRFLGRRRLHLVGGPLGGARSLLGREERPSRPQGADAAGPYRIHRFDDAVRNGAAPGTGWSDRRRADLHPVRHLSGDLRCVGQLDAVRDPGLSCRQDPPERPRRRLVGAVLLVRAWNDHRPGRRALVRPAVSSDWRDRCSPSR